MAEKLRYQIIAPGKLSFPLGRRGLLRLESAGQAIPAKRPEEVPTLSPETEEERLNTALFIKALEARNKERRGLGTIPKEREQQEK